MTIYIRLSAVNSVVYGDLVVVADDMVAVTIQYVNHLHEATIATCCNYTNSVCEELSY